VVRVVVKWPLVGLRQLPGESPSPWSGARWLKDPFLDSQLLHGDQVEVLAQRGDWSWVAVPTQPRYRGMWQPYLGWVPTQALTAVNDPLLETVRSWTLNVHEAPEGACKGVLGRGSRLAVRDLAPSPRWREIATGGWVQAAELQTFRGLGTEDLERLASDWLGTPYLWGGTSAFIPEWQEHHSGVDCSGLIWALWRVLGRVVPRDSHDQWLLARPLRQAHELRLGDLVFFSGPEPNARIHHVMLALDSERLIESSGSRGCVHFSAVAERCQATPETPNGAWTGTYRVWFGRLPDAQSES
jgi:hypothetical protein